MTTIQATVAGQGEVVTAISGPSRPADGMVLTVAAGSARPTARRQPTTFRIVFEIGDDVYHVAPLQPHPEVAAKAYRFRKLTGAGEVYDVRQTEEFTECDCIGFESHRKPCKHIRTLQAAGMLA